jgi:pimeloyl-ACP methyl ester carboxylesterase
MSGRYRASGFTVLVAWLSLATLACSTPISVTKVDPAIIQRSLATSAVANGKPSDATRTVLEEEGLIEHFEDEPESVLKTVHTAIVSGRRRTRALYALAELSYIQGLRSGDRRYYLGAAVYAWAFLFPENPDDAPNQFDRRLRSAADIYNHALAAAFKSADGATVELRAGVFPLPFGEIEVTFDSSTLAWRGRELGPFVSVAELDVEGLRARYRESGLGAPLAAGVKPIDPQHLAYDLLGPNVKIPATALLELPRGTGHLDTPRFRGILTLHVTSDADTVTVDGRTIPLENEPTATLAYALSDSPLWSRELGGFFKSLIPNPGARAQLGAVTPYRPGLMPVVFVHGTASSPARWAQMYNRLANNARIEGKYQFWFFAYDTGAPIPYSARVLRDSLREAVRSLDPDGRDQALKHMVLIGHSQGGLLVKMAVISTGSKLWDGVAREPLDDLKVSDTTRADMRTMMFIEPLPFVERVVFMSTPHRGSFQARNVVADLFRRIVTLPVDVARTGKDLVTGNPDAFRVPAASGNITSLDNMNPLRPFIRSLAEVPVVPQVHVHSIIAVKGNGLLEKEDDGVVAYKSAYIEGAESTLVVHSGHSSQETPQGIEEVLRILTLHASTVEERNAK